MNTPNRRTGLATRSWLLLIAIAAVLISVSLSRLHVFAVHQNERDALFLLARLAERVPFDGSAEAAGSSRPTTALPTTRAGLDLRGILGAGSDTADSQRWQELERLGDLRWLSSGKVLHRHGYFFDLVGTPAANGQGLVAYQLRAWPRVHGRTGIAAFAWCSERGLIAHPNREPRWNGLDRMPEAGAGWQPLPSALLP